MPPNPLADDEDNAEVVLLVDVTTGETLVSSDPYDSLVLLVVAEEPDSQGNVAAKGSWLAATEVKFAV